MKINQQIEFTSFDCTDNLLGLNIKSRQLNYNCIILYQDEFGVGYIRYTCQGMHAHNEYVSYQELFEQFEKLDETKCGK